MQSQSMPTLPDPSKNELTKRTAPRQRRQLLLYMAFLCLCFGSLLNLSFSPIAWAQARIQTGTTPTTAFLQVDDYVLLDRPGFHLSKPFLSPDGRWLAVTLVPNGAGTASLAETYLYATATAQLVARFPTYSPAWSADSSRLHTENGEGTFVYHLAQQRLEQTSVPVRSSEESSLFSLARLPLSYPQTIRVIHHASNGCRSVAVGQVDVIPFEEYVARVVPAEVPASWPAAALEAMAVAARTYAWQQILAGRRDYDVSDWANSQVMCDARYAGTDSAVTATAGQYLTAKTEASGLPISAMYSAENGHPTLTNPNVTYLQAVPDLFALGRERWGHGYGLSQWGAYRRAQAGQNYRQILGHYYSKVYLQNGQDPTLVTGGLTGILPQAALATDRLHLSALVPAAAAARIVITASAGLTAPVALPGSEAIWQAAQPLPEKASVTAQLWLHDQLHDQVTLNVDHTPPAAPLLQLPAVLTQAVADIAFPTVANATPLLSTGWAWQGRNCATPPTAAPPLPILRLPMAWPGKRERAFINRVSGTAPTPPNYRLGIAIGRSSGCGPVLAKGQRPPTMWLHGWMSPTTMASTA
ncbi:MAG: SpoIID/LytB domain-containing protein [Caldilineaceae bacterium]